MVWYECFMVTTFVGVESLSWRCYSLVRFGWGSKDAYFHTPFSFSPSFCIYFLCSCLPQRAKVTSYGTALASQGKKYYLGKYNKLLPPTDEAT